MSEIKDQNTELQLASFLLGDKLFAVDIMRIKEIVIPQKMVTMPLEHTALSGMINLRGQVIPVVNLRAFFGMPPYPAGSGRLMIVTISGRQIALAVDDLDEVITVQTIDLKPPPDLFDGSGSEYLIAVCLYKQQLYLLLDPDALFSNPLLQQLPMDLEGETAHDNA